MSKERRLGRGLEALLGRSFEAQSQDTPVGEQQYESFEAAPQFDSGSYQSHASTDENVTRSADGQQWLGLVSIDRNPYQPRTNFDEAEIADLCDSIRTHGFLQPIVNRG